MEKVELWNPSLKCNLCEAIPRNTPLYLCPLQHQYCNDCYSDLQNSYRGCLKTGATCLICKTSAVFTPSTVNVAFLNKTKTGSPRGKIYHPNTNLLNRIETRGNHEKRVSVESLFQLPSEKLNNLLNKKNHLSPQMVSRQSQQEEPDASPCGTSTSSLVSQPSKMPIKCPLTSCQKVIATTAFFTHFKHEHSTIPKYSIERGKVLCIPCNISIIKHNTNFCLGMITVYEVNRIDVSKSQSSKSVIKTCGKLSQQVPIDSFWIMATGSPEKKQYISSAIFWLFCPSEVNYQATIEISSNDDSISFSTYCEVHISCQKLQFNDIAECLHCLLLSKFSLGALLHEGPDLNLRITLH